MWDSEMNTVYNASWAILPQEEAEALFMQGQAPMYLNGSWTSSVSTGSHPGCGQGEGRALSGDRVRKSTIYDSQGA